MTRPAEVPIGLLLARTAKAVGRAFDDALAEAGGSRPTWLILLALKSRAWGTQAELARSLDISGPTLTHHLDSLEAEGLVTRTRDPENRRVHVVELTASGDDLFHRLREAAMTHDRKLRAGLEEDDLGRLRNYLGQLQDNVTEDVSRL